MMGYEKCASAVFLLSTFGTIVQLLILPFVINEADQTKLSVQGKIKEWQILSESAEIHLLQIRDNGERFKRDSSLCNTEPGPPGDPGYNGEDGEQGDDGPDGPPGMDAHQMMLTTPEKCIVCPLGPKGVPGPPGDRGMPGLPGEKGIPGIPGMDGHEGEMGLEGPIGFNGTVGKVGQKGTDGIPAIGGIGEPGPKGMPGPIGGAGPQGPRGKKSYVYGPPGVDGKPGMNGLDGVPGSPGLRGEKGPPGETGADVKFCPCPSELKSIDDEKIKESSSPIKATPKISKESTLDEGLKQSNRGSKSDALPRTISIHDAKKDSRKIGLKTITENQQQNLLPFFSKEFEDENASSDEDTHTAPSVPGNFIPSVFIPPEQLTKLLQEKRHSSVNQQMHSRITTPKNVHTYLGKLNAAETIGDNPVNMRNRNVKLSSEKGDVNNYTRGETKKMEARNPSILHDTQNEAPANETAADALTSLLVKIFQPAIDASFEKNAAKVEQFVDGEETQDETSYENDGVLDQIVTNDKGDQKQNSQFPNAEEQPGEEFPLEEMLPPAEERAPYVVTGSLTNDNHRESSRDWHMKAEMQNEVIIQQPKLIQQNDAEEQDSKVVSVQLASIRDRIEGARMKSRTPLNAKHPANHLNSQRTEDISLTPEAQTKDVMDTEPIVQVSTPFSSPSHRRFIYVTKRPRIQE